MTRTILTLAAIALLSACGVDGPPVQPAATVTVKPGVTVTGDATIGMRGDL